MASKEIREMHFTCDGCETESAQKKEENGHTYPAGWFRVVFRGKTDAGRREFDLCPKCTRNMIDGIEEGGLDCKESI
jgi:hypothetical protein